jgi:Ser/Thr protein kinase RdoA (MazF antagonist)
MRDVYRRIGYGGKLEEISHAVCSRCNLGEFASNNLVFIGYGDFNFALETTKGKYFVKVFATSKSDEHCQRLVDVVTEAVKANVKTPKLYKTEQDYIHRLELSDCNLRLCVMEYIEGQDIYSLGDTLSPEEMRTIAQQAALINSIDIKPPPIYDSWVVVNFLEEFRRTKKYLSMGDLELIEPLLQEFEDLKIYELPHCFVHGDITATNVMRDNENELWTVDFCDASYNPRIQELAVLAGNLFFNPESKTKSEENLNLALEAYQEKIKLTDRELKALPIYLKLSRALYIMETTYAKSVKNNTSEENKYWYRQARAGLEQMS